ncbi:Transcriptional regulator, LysR family [uncultured Alphaproteobacteria bacterium]|uniref:Transcriptional regulator, LysR family n=1 Tax=uncultured Alphaproteobacteria bacterium TaxID=91750 RepID=A0A212K400_9PROT|nr:Transcriptional regulator, LysR family [uncultured Alphaproteobacteria bacterium]
MGAPPAVHSAAMKYFLEVARSGSIAEASARLNVAASAISRQIAHLEAEVGASLFERRARGMTLSSAGELLAAHARRAHLDSERVLAEIRGLAHLGTGVVTVATSEGFAIDLLPAAIARFRAAYAGIRFRLEAVPPAEVSRRVADGDVDIGLTFSLAPIRGIRIERSWPAPILALMRADHPLAQRKSLRLAELAAHPLALPDKDTTIRQLLDISAAAEAIPIEPALTSNYMGALRNFSRFGGGVSLTSRLSVSLRFAEDGMVLVPIADPGMHVRRMELQTMAERTLPHAAQGFLAHLAQTIERLLAAP